MRGGASRRPEPIAASREEARPGRSRGIRSSAIVLAALITASCGARLLKLPAGAGTPIPPQDAAAALAQATGACQAIRTLTAEIAVSGSAGGHRLRGRLSAGVAAPASARLEAVAPLGPPLFIFVATGDDATLLLPRDERVLEHGRADAVLDAVAGVPLTAADLEAILTGCATAEPAAAQAQRFGDEWQVLTRTGGDALYLHRERAAEPWRLVAVVRRSEGARPWRADYQEFGSGGPRTIRIISLPQAGDGQAIGAAFDLRLTLSQVDTNVPLDAAAFTVRIPPSAAPISLEELRRSGPLAPKSDAK